MDATMDEESPLHSVKTLLGTKLTLCIFFQGAARYRALIFLKFFFASEKPPMM